MYTLGYPLALRVTSADARDRADVAALLAEVREQTNNHGEVAFIDQRHTSEAPAASAAARGVELAVVALPQSRRCLVLLTKCWVVEHSFACPTKVRRLADFHPIALACLLLARHLTTLAQAHD